MTAPAIADGVSVAPEPQSRRTARDRDGYLYDVETGEVLGHSEVAEAFHIETAEQVDWALERRARIEAELLAVRARKRALLENLAAIERDAERRLAWWEFRFRPEVVAFARSAIEGTRSRTARFAYGSVAFRTSPGTRQILDMGAAVAFVEKYAPGLVKVARTVNLKAVDEAAGSYREATEEEPELGPFLATSGPREGVTIETGILDAKGGES